jgi:hypothetical protein
MMAKSLDLLLAERRVGDPRVTFVRFFADDRYMTPEERIPGERGHTIERLNNGTAHRIQRISHEPAELERRLSVLGRRSTSGRPTGLYCGAGGRLRR